MAAANAAVAAANAKATGTTSSTGTTTTTGSTTTGSTTTSTSSSVSAQQAAANQAVADAMAASKQNFQSQVQQMQSTPGIAAINAAYGGGATYDASDVAANQAYHNQLVANAANAATGVKGDPSCWPLTAPSSSSTASRARSTTLSPQTTSSRWQPCSRRLIMLSTPERAVMAHISRR
eukprot:jgi/Botrbrau1/2893/Bobra.0036s0035.1